MVRTSVVLAVVAAALLAYILVFERGSISSGEREQRKGNALREFVRARVEKLEIQRKDVTIVLTRDPEADVEDDAVLWHVQAPYRAKADQDAVDTLLGELEWLDGRRKLEGIDAADRKRFGLTAPRYRLWFTVGKTRVPVVVGNESPRGDGVYVGAGDENAAFVVGKNLSEALDAEPGEYHTKELHDGVLVSTSIGLVLRDAQGERDLRKGADGLWRFERGAAGLASTQAITEIVDALDGLRAKRFVAQNVKDLARYGLDQPRFELRVRTTTLAGLPKGKEPAPRKESTLRLRVGAACSGHAGESYLAIDDANTVHCAADEDLSKLGKPLAALREARLLPLEEGEVSDVQVARGDQKLALSRADETWSYDVTRAGKTELEGEARPEAVPDWLKALSALAAERFDAQLPPGAKPLLVARFGRGKDKPAFELRLFAAGAAELIVQRGDEPVAVAFAASASELLAPEAARFRKLRLLDHSASALQRLEITRGTQVERLARTDGDLIVEAPVRVAADPIAASEVARLLGSLEAVRFVADEPAPSHGLSAPSSIAAAEFSPATGKGAAAPAPTRVSLRLGAATEGGRFAEIAGARGVFVASAQLADLLAAPLASRALLATPLERLRAVEVEQGARKVRVERSGTAFTAAAGSDLGGRTPQAVAEAVATLRAQRVAAYGPPEPAHGLQRPYARVTVTAEGESGEQRHAITLGAEVDIAPPRGAGAMPPAAGGRYARRDDQPITFVLPAAAVAALAPAATTSPPPRPLAPAPASDDHRK